MDKAKMQEEFNKCVEHLKEELAQLRTGRATAELIEPVEVEAYGTTQPLKNVGNISVADAKSLVVQVWDKSILDDVVNGIRKADLGLGISVEGDTVRVSVPDLNEERRLDLVKVMGERVETARMAVRNVRKEHMKEIDESVKGGVSEDVGKTLKTEVEEEVKLANEQIEELREAKEKDLMSV